LVLGLGGGAGAGASVGGGAMSDAHHTLAPAAWLVGHRALLPPSGRALDVACGRGRHALWLAQHGFDAEFVDVPVVTSGFGTEAGG